MQASSNDAALNDRCKRVKRELILSIHALAFLSLLTFSLSPFCVLVFWFFDFLLFTDHLLFAIVRPAAVSHMVRVRSFRF